MDDLADVAALVPLRSHLLRVRDGGNRALRRASRLLDGLYPHPALPSFRPWWTRSGGEARANHQRPTINDYF